LQNRCSVSSGSASNVVDAPFERELQCKCSIGSGSVKGNNTVATTTQWLVDSTSDINSTETMLQSQSSMKRGSVLLEHIPR